MLALINDWITPPMNFWFVIPMTFIMILVVCFLFTFAIEGFDIKRALCNHKWRHSSPENTWFVVCKKCGKTTYSCIP